MAEEGRHIRALRPECNMNIAGRTQEESAKAWRDANPGANAARCKACRDANPGVDAARSKAWRERKKAAVTAGVAGAAIV